MNKKNILIMCASLYSFSQALASQHSTKLVLAEPKKTYLQALVEPKPKQTIISTNTVSPLVALLQALIEYETQLALQQQQEEALEALNALQAENN